MKTRKDTAKLASHLLMSAIATILFFMSTLPAEVHAQNDARVFPALQEFIATVTDGHAETLRGVYVPQVMALTVVQQAGGDSRFISKNNLESTQFNMAARIGNVGLLAHNQLAGKFFFLINENDPIILVYGNGRTEMFAVENIIQYQALPRGMYKDLTTQDVLGTGELFNAMYGGDYHVTFQTCIEKSGNSNWGRLFVIAKPVNSEADDEIETRSITESGTDISQMPLVLGWPLAAFRPHAGMISKMDKSLPLY